MGKQSQIARSLLVFFTVIMSLVSAGFTVLGAGFNPESGLDGSNPGIIDNEEIIEYVKLLISPDNTIRANAEQKLEDLGDASITAIEKVLRDLDPETKVLRGVAAKFLARIKSPRALPALLFSVNNDEDTFTRVNAIHSLAKIGIANSEVLSTLGEALFDLDEDVRTAAAEALGAFGEPAGEYGIDLLLLSHSSSARFAWACRVAAGKAAPGIMSFTDDTIEEIISRLPTLEWQDLAATALGRNANKTLPRVAEIAFDQNQLLGMRIPALKAIERSGVLDQVIVARLLDLIACENESPLIKMAARDVLVKRDPTRYPELADQIAAVIADNPLSQYVSDNRIPIQVENFAVTDRENVLIRAVIGFPAEYKIESEADYAVRDEDSRALYFRMKPLSYWEDNLSAVRAAEIEFYADLKAQDRGIYYVDFNQHERPAAPAVIDASGQVRVSIPEQGMDVISTPNLDLGERWLMQLVVAQDGSGNFPTVQAAVDAIPGFNDQRVIVYIKEGFYHEKLIIPADKDMITFIGENRDTTILNFNETPYVQYSTDAQYRIANASTAILSDDFTAENITFSNSAPVGTGQALAVDLRGDRMVFTNCKFVSHQDTVFANTQGRLYFYRCHIEGDVDFIYGPATAVFEECDIVNVRKTGGYVTAASTPPEKEFGLVFINSRIIGDVNPGSVWLGRPWRPYGHTAYINCYMSEVVQPTGWHNWGKPSNEETARYEEYNSYGPGANPDSRVKWSRQLTDAEGSHYTVENILKGDDGWNPKR